MNFPGMLDHTYGRGLTNDGNNILIRIMRERNQCNGFCKCFAGKKHTKLDGRTAPRTAARGDAGDVVMRMKTATTSSLNKLKRPEIRVDCRNEISITCHIFKFEKTMMIYTYMYKT